MTAAHCINYGNYRVHVGKHDLTVNEDGSKTISAQKIIVHEKWNPWLVELGNDIALIKLSKPVTLSDTVQLGCVPPAGSILENNYPCYITGWRRLSSKCLWITPPAPGLTGGIPPSWKPWSALVEMALSLAAMVTLVAP